MPGGKGYVTPFSKRMEKVIVAPNGCWQWQGVVLKNGYGQLMAQKKHWLAHRFFYEELVGPIPEGLHLDHTCHNNSDCTAGDQCLHRRCVNPVHLEPVKQKVNTNRGRRANSLKTHCPQGHEYTAATTYVTTQDHRLCKTCARGRKKQPHYFAQDAKRQREKRARKTLENANLP